MTLLGIYWRSTYLKSKLLGTLCFQKCDASVEVQKPQHLY